MPSNRPVPTWRLRWCSSTAGSRYFGPLVDRSTAIVVRDSQARAAPPIISPRGAVHASCAGKGRGFHPPRRHKADARHGRTLGRLRNARSAQLFRVASVAARTSSARYHAARRGRLCDPRLGGGARRPLLPATRSHDGRRGDRGDHAPRRSTRLRSPDPAQDPTAGAATHAAGTAGRRLEVLARRSWARAVWLRGLPARNLQGGAVSGPRLTTAWTQSK